MDFEKLDDFHAAERRFINPGDPNKEESWIRCGYTTEEHPNHIVVDGEVECSIEAGLKIGWIECGVAMAELKEVFPRVPEFALAEMALDHIVDHLHEFQHKDTLKQVLERILRDMMD